MKRRREHRVPLSGQAMEVLEEARTLGGGGAGTQGPQPGRGGDRRTDLFERRTRLMDDWEAYLTGERPDPEAAPIRR